MILAVKTQPISNQPSDVSAFLESLTRLDAHPVPEVGTLFDRIIAQLAGLPVKRVDQTVVVDDPRWSGYLANLATSEFEEEFAARLPERIGGAEFFELYGGTTDAVTRVEPERSYAVRAPTAHAVYESFRVKRFAELLQSEERNELTLDLGRELGDLMYASHASYSSCGLGSPGTDDLVEFVRSLGLSRGLYGAKITGGGSGGTVAVLGSRTAGAAIKEVAESYARKTGYTPYVFSGSSPGSARFGHVVVEC
jgi:L-arabinokinase